MQNFQDTFQTRNWSFIGAFSIYMTVSLTNKIKINELKYSFKRNPAKRNGLKKTTNGWVIIMNEVFKDTIAP